MILQLYPKIVQSVAQMPGISACWLFGSQALGHARPDSDVDIALLFTHDQVPDFMALMSKQEELARILEKKVDLVCLNDAGPIIGKQVLDKGKVLKVFEEDTFLRYRMTNISMYEDLKRVRAPYEKKLIEDIKNVKR